MAFVLGHELGHMAEDDYWHFKTFMTLDGDSE
jgi:Zn-dependent protease with chaperone function